MGIKELGKMSSKSESYRKNLGSKQYSQNYAKIAWKHQNKQKEQGIKITQQRFNSTPRGDKS